MTVIDKNVKDTITVVFVAQVFKSSNKSSKITHHHANQYSELPRRDLLDCQRFIFVLLVKYNSMQMRCIVFISIYYVLATNT